LQERNKHTDAFDLSALFKRHFKAVNLFHHEQITAVTEEQLRKIFKEKHPQEKFEVQKNHSCVCYPFGIREIYFDKESLDEESLYYVTNFEKPNLGLLLPESFQLSAESPFFATDTFHIQQQATANSAFNFPLYEYSGKDLFHKKVNLNMDITREISLRNSLEFLPEDPGKGNVCFVQHPDLRDDFKTFYTPAHLLDYIYAVLHTKQYDSRNKTIWIPYPEENSFWRDVAQGQKLRQSHLVQKRKI